MVKGLIRCKITPILVHTTHMQTLAMGYIAVKCFNCVGWSSHYD